MKAPQVKVIFGDNWFPAWLSQPDTWQRAARAIGTHDFTYDLSDASHRIDVVQIVADALAQAFKEDLA